MGSTEVFIIRFAVSIIISLLICRFFFSELEMLRVFILALFMMGLAYFLEYLRKRN
jgi:hypothetical protein